MLASEICRYLERSSTTMTPHEVARAAFAIVRKAEAEGIEATESNAIDLYKQSNVDLTRMNENLEAAGSEAKEILQRFCDDYHSVTKAELAQSYLRTIRATAQASII